MEIRNAEALFAKVGSAEFLRAAAEGRLRRPDYVRWGQQMLYLSRCFKTSMVRAIGQALENIPPRIEVGSVISANLYDELGSGQCGQRYECSSGGCHIRLLEQFIQELGGEPWVPATDPTLKCVLEHDRLSRTGLPENLATIWANEVCCPIEFSAVRKGVAGLSEPMDQTKLFTYLDVNLASDAEHGQATFRVLRPYIMSDVALVDAAVTCSVNALSSFYDGLLRA